MARPLLLHDHARYQFKPPYLVTYSLFANSKAVGVRRPCLARFPRTSTP